MREITSSILYPSTSPSSSSNSISLLEGFDEVLDSDSLYNVFDKTQFLHFTEGSQLVDTEVSICTLNIFLDYQLLNNFWNIKKIRE